MAFFSSDFLSAMKPIMGATKRAFICEITAKEIAYQKTTIALANWEKLNGAAQSLRALTGQQVALAPISDIPVHVLGQVINEIKKNNFGSIETPLKSINWGEIVDDAVWRRAPFEGNSESKNEKGFRDAVFVQTALSAVRAESKAAWCVLTNDGLVYERLRLENARPGALPFSVFRTTEELLGHIDVHVHKVTEVLAANLQAKAHVAFYDPSTKAGVFVSCDVEKAIRAKFSNNLENIPKLTGPAGFNTLLSFEIWSRASGEQIFLEGTRFSKRQSQKRFQWITRVRMCAAFNKAALGNQYVFPPSVIRDTRFDVHWSADVDGDVFSAPSVDNLILVSNERLSDSAFTRGQLGLPLPEGSLFAQVGAWNASTNVAVPSGIPPPPLPN